jgi:hypothetical protein
MSGRAPVVDSSFWNGYLAWVVVCDGGRCCMLRAWASWASLWRREGALLVPLVRVRVRVLRTYAACLE